MNKRHSLWLVFGAVVLTLSFPISSSARHSGETFVDGSVTQAGNRPLRSAWVIIKRGEAEKGRYLTGDDGRFYIGDLEAGAYELVVEKAGRALCRKQISLPENSHITLQCEGK